MDERGDRKRQGTRCQISVLIHIYAGLRRRLGQPQIEVNLRPGATVEDLFRHLAKAYDEEFSDLIVRPAGEPSISVVILNGHTLRLPSELKRELSMGDELHLIPPIAGG